jgi:hypothetical protein
MAGRLGKNFRSRDLAEELDSSFDGVGAMSQGTTAKSAGRTDMHYNEIRFPVDGSGAKAERTCITMKSASRLTDQAQVPNPFKAKWFGSPSNAWVRVIELPLCGMF